MQTLAAPGVNWAPAPFHPERDLPAGFAQFYRPLHEQFTPRQREAVAQRRAVLGRAHQGELPTYLYATKARPTDWRIALPPWCADQRNQMTGPADDAELVVKMLNSGAPGVMLDLEDSMANTWDHLMQGHDNLIAALSANLTYDDQKRGQTVGIKPSTTVIWNRVRGLHLSQAGIFDDFTSASLFDVALIAYRVDIERLANRTLCIYIPKSESAEEAHWWRDLFDAIIEARGWPEDAIKCMALVEAHPSVPARRIQLQFAQILGRFESRALGLHGEPHPFQSCRSAVGVAGSQYHSARRAVLSAAANAHSGSLPQALHARHRRNDRAVS